MMLDEAAKEFEFDCSIRHLSPKTIDNYRKQLRYLQRFLEKDFSVSTVEDVKPSHIKRFLSMMDDAGRKPQYINDLLKVFKTFFNPFFRFFVRVVYAPSERAVQRKNVLFAPFVIR